MPRSAMEGADRLTAQAGARAPLALLLLAVVIGIALDRFTILPWRGWLILGGAAFIGWIACFRGAHLRIGTLSLGLLTVAIGGGWHHLYWNYYPANHLHRWASPHPAPVCCTARVLCTPTVQPPQQDPLQPIRDTERTRFRVEVDALRMGHAVEGDGWVSSSLEWQPVSGQADVFVNGIVDQLPAGARVQLFGRLSLLTAQRNPGGYAALDRGRHRRVLCRLAIDHPESLQLLAMPSAWDCRWWIEFLHARCRGTLFHYLPQESAALAAAVLLGDREALGPHDVDSFFVTGTVHLLAISGLHLAIVVRALFLLTQLMRLPRQARLQFVIWMTVFYALLTGARPPVVRAAVLVVTLCLELMLLRPRFSFNSLAAAGLVILAINPTNLFQSGVQLSFLAVATLIWLARFDRMREVAQTVDRAARPHRPPTVWTYLGGKAFGQFRQTARAGVAIWIVSLPLVMHQFHLVPLSGLVLNLGLLVPLSLALYSGLLVMLFGWCAPLATCFAYGCEGCLAFMVHVVRWAEQWELSHAWVAGPVALGVLVFYGVLVAFGAFKAWASRWPFWLAGAFGSLCVATLSSHLARQPAQAAVECSFLSVGHGVCVVLRLPHDEVWLYDAGSLGSTRSTLREVASFLWSQRVTRVEGIVLSHGDTDHFNVVPELLKRFDVQQICTSAALLESADAAVAELILRIEQAGVPIRLISRGERLTESREGCISCRHPAWGARALSDNANSVVLEIAYFGKRLLLTGDLESEGLDHLLSSEPLDCDVVMAPHHGSRHSRPVDVARWCQPEWVVVSGGDPDGAREAEAIYRQSGARVLHTALRGAVTAVLRADGIKVLDLQAMSPTGTVSLVATMRPRS